MSYNLVLAITAAFASSKSNLSLGIAANNRFADKSHRSQVLTGHLPRDIVAKVFNHLWVFSQRRGSSRFV